MNTENQRLPLDVASIFRDYGQAFLDKHALCPDQLKAFRAISECRTAAMGGHLERCDHCEHQRIAYNSCRNRNCNKCQFIKQLRWVDKLKSTLPVCPYFHMVFTLPSVLHKTFYLNQRVCYNLLFQAVSQTLMKVSRNRQFLGAQTGAVAVLHTWGQALTYHPHIHLLVPAGGLSDDGTEWVKAGKKFFLPVKALSKVFRGIVWTLLEKNIRSQSIKLPDDWHGNAQLKSLLYAKNWNVYTKKPLAGPQSVVQYLGKYTHRVAISNSRLRSLDQGKITFSWKDYRIGAGKQVLCLDADEFIGRFLRHILPSGFFKIRYYGILASANKSKKQQVVWLIDKPQPASLLQGLSAKQVLQIVMGKDPDTCPKCKIGRLLPKTILDPV